MLGTVEFQLVVREAGKKNPGIPADRRTSATLQYGEKMLYVYSNKQKTQRAKNIIILPKIISSHARIFSEVAADSLFAASETE